MKLNRRKLFAMLSSLPFVPKARTMPSMSYSSNFNPGPYEGNPWKGSIPVIPPLGDGVQGYAIDCVWEPTVGMTSEECRKLMWMYNGKSALSGWDVSMTPEQIEGLAKIEQQSELTRYPTSYE
jgi:hypothetical protein